MNCQSCASPLPVAAFGGYIVCEHCHTRNRMEESNGPIEDLSLIRPLEGSSCPRCCGELTAALLEDAPIKFCEKCHGLLISHDDFSYLLRHRRAEFQGRETKPMPFNPVELMERCDCPDCGKTMECHPYFGPGNVVIDSCVSCGWVWLDGEEFNRLIASPGQRTRV